MYQSVHELRPARQRRLGSARPLQVLAVPFGGGAGDRRTALAPSCLARAGLMERLRQSAGSVKWRTLASEDRSRAASPDASFRQVLSAASETAAGVECAIAAGHQFLVLGGDHSIAAGTWAGAARAVRKRGRIGLVWIDAHMDAHVPETSPSGNWHGMPLAHLLGYGRPELTMLAGGPAAIKPEHLCLVGVRSYEVEEALLLNELGVSVIHADEVRRMGPRLALNKALSTVGRGTVAVGVSLDMDAIDPSDAPGVGTPVSHGVPGPALTHALRGLAAVPAFVGLEIVEYNPPRDRHDRTRALVANLAVAILASGDAEQSNIATIGP